MPSLQDQATHVMHEAVGLEKQGNYVDALRKYEDGLSLFRTIILQKKSGIGETAQTPAAAAELKGLEQYVLQLAGKIRTLSSAVQAVASADAAKKKKEEPPAAMSSSSTSTCCPKGPPPSNPSKIAPKAANSDQQQQQESTNVLDGLSVPSGQISGPAKGTGKGTPSEPAPDRKKDSHRDPEAVALPPPPPPSQSTVPQKKQRPDGPMSDAGANFAPRASEVVLKAIDVATALVKQNRIKEAIDILQHAFDEGKKETYNPKNFSLVNDMLLELRRKYYQANKPRLLQDNGPTDEEMTLLRRSGRTETLLLPIWDDVNEGYGAENMYMPTKTDQWIDNFTPKLSPKQRNLKCEMKSVREVMSAVDLSIITDADPLNVKQTVVGDCSLVCSLIICASFQHRFPNAKVLSSVIYPQDASGKPVVSKKGKYAVKMLVNGITRVVVVDDRLPVEAGSKRLLCTYSKDPKELWVSIMEKAFVKVCGGSYDFPGSNSSTDMYKLSGWLPDSLALDGEGFNAAFQWTRLSTCHQKGAVLITANTPQNMDKTVEEHLKLVPGHAYAVLDFTEFKGKQLVKIKNPWSTASSWEGAFAIKDKENCTEEFCTAVGYNEEQSAQGVFWILWSDVVTYFKRLHLSWNPYLLFPKAGGLPTRPTRIACHALLSYEFPSLGSMPQFHIAVASAPAPTRMHLVFSRHVLDLREYAIENPEKDKSLPLVAIHVFATSHCPTIGGLSSSGHGRCMPGRCVFGRRIVHGLEVGEAAQLLNGVYKQVPAHTGSFTCPAGKNMHFTVVVAQHEGTPGGSFPFSLTLHTELPLGDGGVSMHAIGQLDHSSTIRGAWKLGQNCGGKVDSQTFSYNPQYAVTLASPSRIFARLATSVAEPVQLFLARPRQDDAGSNIIIPWRGRLPTVSSDVCSVAMQFPMYAHFGCSVDSSLGTCLLFDSTGSLKPAASQQGPAAALEEAPKPPPPPAAFRTVALTLVAAGAAPGPHPQHILAIDTAKMLLVAALARNVFVSSLHSKIVGEGRALDLATRLFSVNSEKFTVVAGTDEMQRSQPLQLAITESAALALNIMRNVHDAAVAVDSQAVRWPEGAAKELLRLDEAVTQLLLRVDGLECATDEIRSCRKAVVGMLSMLHDVIDELGKEGPKLTTILGSASSSTSSSSAEAKKKVAELIPAVPLAPLPPGTYTLVASCWAKGTPGPFEIVVQTETPHEIREIPPEGSGFESSVAQGQFRNVAFTAAALPTAVPLTSPLFSDNTHVTVTFGKGLPDGPVLLCARVLTMEADAKAARSSVPILLALYKCDEDAGSASLVTTSGAFSASGSAIDATAVDGKVRHLLLVLPGGGSTVKFVVRLFCSSKFAAVLA